MITPGVSILMPTRGRPKGVRELITSALDTANGEIEFIMYADCDDRTLGELRKVVDDHAPIARLLVGPRLILSEGWNICWRSAQADVFMHCGDDIRFRTSGWDTTVLKEFHDCPDRILLVYGEDGIQHDHVATHGFYSRRAADCVGYFMPPYFASDWNDAWWTDVYRALGRLRYLPNVYTEHMHPVAGKGPMDRTHNERLTRHAQLNVDQIYNVQTRELRELDIVKLRTWMED